MKKVIFLFALILLLISCSDDAMAPLDVELKPFIIENYSRDAKLLYYNEVINNKNHPDYNRLKLNDKVQENILKMIQTIYDLQSLETDTIFNIYKIHSHYCYSFNSISLKVKPDLPAIKNLSEGIIPTGDSGLDKLLSEYGFNKVELSYAYPESQWLTISTESEYNLTPVENQLKKLQCIEDAEFNKGCIGDGNHITLNQDKNKATIIFSIGKGDCPAGCIYRRYWEFVVTNGGARFVKSY